MFDSIVEIDIGKIVFDVRLMLLSWFELMKEFWESDFNDFRLLFNGE